MGTKSTGILYGLVAVAFAALALACPSGALGQTASSLSFVAPSDLTLVGEADTTTATVTLRNGSAQPVRLDFTILVDPVDTPVSAASPPDLTVELADPAHNTLDGLGVDQFRLVFTGTGKFSGTLVAAASVAAADPAVAEPVAPATIPVTFTPAREGLVHFPDWASALTWQLLAVCLGVGLALTFGRYLFSRRVWPWVRREDRLALDTTRKTLEAELKDMEGSTEPNAALARKAKEAQLADVQRQLDAPLRWALGNTMGGVEWDLQKSYGSALGLAASVLQLITGTAFFPTELFKDKGEYYGLVLTFAVLTLVAPMVYAVCQRKSWPQDTGKPPDPEWIPITTSVSLDFGDPPLKGTLTSTREDPPAEEEVLGYTWAFLVASAVTIGAVSGQVWIVFLLLEELLKAQVVSNAGIYLLDGAIFVTAILLGVYFVRTLGWIVDKQARETKEVPAVPAAGQGVGPQADRTIVRRPPWSPL